MLQFHNIYPYCKSIEKMTYIIKMLYVNFSRNQDVKIIINIIYYKEIKRYCYLQILDFYFHLNSAKKCIVFN